MPFAIPLMLVCLVIAWLLLQLAFFNDIRNVVNWIKGKRKSKSDMEEETARRKKMTQMLRERYESLGSLR